ncbi:hypothetical protein RIF29_35370 [Crotalaria pallida]|uniref:Uncharacterized protein n=1 Tax=Crotalaria pallida TaxID=3830 RepID=A0AAN9EB13_CROPI
MSPISFAAISQFEGGECGSMLPEATRIHVLRDINNQLHSSVDNCSNNEGLAVGSAKMAVNSGVGQQVHVQKNNVSHETYLLRSRKQVGEILSTLTNGNEEVSCLYTPPERKYDTQDTIHLYMDSMKSAASVNNLQRRHVVLSPKEGQRMNYKSVNQIVRQLSKEFNDPAVEVPQSHHSSKHSKVISATSLCVTNINNRHAVLSPVKGKRKHYKSVNHIVHNIADHDSEDFECKEEKHGDLSRRPKRQQYSMYFERNGSNGGPSLGPQCNEYAIGQKSVGELW